MHRGGVDHPESEVARRGNACRAPTDSHGGLQCGRSGRERVPPLPDADQQSGFDCRPQRMCRGSGAKEFVRGGESAAQRDFAHEVHAARVAPAHASRGAGEESDLSKPDLPKLPDPPSSGDAPDLPKLPSLPKPPGASGLPKPPKVIPQARPIFALLEAVKNSDQKQLKTVFCERYRKGFDEEGWDKVLATYQKYFKKEFVNYKPEDFTFEYKSFEPPPGPSEEVMGMVSITRKGKKFGELRVIKENAVSKMAER